MIALIIIVSDLIVKLNKFFYLKIGQATVDSGTNLIFRKFACLSSKYFEELYIPDRISRPVASGKVCKNRVS